MLEEKIKADLISAQKEKAELTVSTLRFLLAKLTNARIDKGQALVDAEIEAEISKEAKRHKESIDAYKKGNRQDLVDQESQELAVLMTYLPEQMPQTELAAIVKATISETGATTKQDMGKVIGAVMTKVRGRADGSAVSALVAQALS